jgi:hypothetical protein
MGHINFSKALYLLTIALFIFSWFVPEVIYTGNFLIDAFPGFGTKEPLIDIYRFIFLFILISSIFLLRRSEGFEKSHFRNIIQVLVIIIFLDAMLYRQTYDVNYPSKFPDDLPSFLTASLLIFYLSWRFLRGAYLALNEREIS